ncbi:MAG TPA: aconitase family protein, partial [Acidimicrobiia bacterium]|nr:aconitase family protein [Acidimicrobiia bacterium]
MNSFHSRASITVGDRPYEIFRLAALEDSFSVHRLPYSLKILLENLLRFEDGVTVSAADIEGLAGGQREGDDREIAFRPARVLMQDFTGVPALVDLAAMRDAVAERGGDPSRLEPGIPADLVIDHSVSVDVFGVRDAIVRNSALEFERNRER